MKSKKLSYINGILATVLVHLLAALLFLTVKITGLQNAPVQVVVEASQEQKEEKAEKLETLEEKQVRLEELQKMADAFIGRQNRSNVGVNVSGKEPSTSDLKQIQSEIEQAQKQIAGIKDNLEKQKATPDKEPEGSEPVAQKHTEKPQGKLAVYKGPTNIYYDLPNRRDVFLYVPVYKCEGYGRVVVQITVNAEGNVIAAKINKSASDDDECLYNAAYDAAMRSRFNAGEVQKGSITYQFVAQK